MQSVLNSQYFLHLFSLYIALRTSTDLWKCTKAWEAKTLRKRHLFVWRIQNKNKASVGEIL